MAIATSLTESEVKQYMQNVLGDTSKKLGWFAADDDFDEPANEVLYVLDKADYTFVISQALVAKTRSVARVEVWRAAMYYTVHESSFSAGAPGTGQTSRADIHRHCKEMFQLSQSEMIQKYPDLGSDESREAEKVSVEYANDYYANAED